MTNQAAQTMPELPDPAFVTPDDNLYTVHQMRAMYQQGYAAALSQTAGVAEGWKLVPVEPTEAMCEAAMSSLGWSRSQAAATAAPITPASPMMEGSMKVWSGMLAAAPAASGVHPDALPDGTLSKSTAKRVDALRMAQGGDDRECASCTPTGVYADDGAGPFDCYACGRKATQPPHQDRGEDLQQRARELLAAQYRHDPEFAATIIEGTGMDSVTYALRAITAALTEAKQQETDGPVDAADDADYLRHVAAKLTRLGYRIMGTVAEGIAIQYAAMAAKQQGPGEAITMRYFANGPEGSFMADDFAFADRITHHFEPEEWTITDTQEAPQVEANRQTGEALRAAYNCIAELPPTQNRSEVLQIIVDAIGEVDD